MQFLLCVLIVLRFYLLLATSRRGLRFIFQPRGPRHLIEAEYAESPTKQDETNNSSSEMVEVVAKNETKEFNFTAAAVVSWAQEIETKIINDTIKKEDVSIVDTQLIIVNEKWVAGQRSRPDFICRPDKDFLKMKEEKKVQLRKNEVLVKTEMLSIDDIARTGLRPGLTCRALGVGRVVASGSQSLKPGTRVIGPLGAQLYAQLDVNLLRATWHEPKTALGLCGRPGLCAYLAFAKRRPKSKDNAFITDAAGAIGHVAAQLCRLAGARCLGLGPQELVSRGITHAAIDLRFENNLAKKLDHFLQEEYLDYVFLCGRTDSMLLRIILSRLRPGATIILVHDSNTSMSPLSSFSEDFTLLPSSDVKNGLLPAHFCAILAEKGVTIVGFNFNHHISKTPDAALTLLWLARRKRLSYLDTTISGLDSFPALLASLSVPSPFFDHVRGPSATRARAISRTRFGHLFLSISDDDN